MMKFLPQIDIGVIGEGENTWVELVDHVFDRRFEEVRGVIFRDEKGNLKVTEPRPLIGMKDSGLYESLDDLPYPAYDLLPMDIYLRNSQIPLSPETLRPDLRRISVVSERGCPQTPACRFCQHLGQSCSDLSRIYDKKIVGPNVRWQSPQYLVNHIKYLRQKFCVNFISILDENFLANKKRCLEFADLMEKEGLVGLVRFGILGHPTTADPEVISRLRDCGLSYVSFGAESSDQTILDALHKRSSPEAIQNAIDTCMKFEVYPITTWMICLPPGELVYTQNSVKRIENVSTNDLCLNRYGEFQRVERKFKREYDGKIVEIKAEGLLPVRVTEDHPILVCDIIRSRYTRVNGKSISIPLKDRLSEPKWVKAKDLKIGQIVMVPRIRIEKDYVIELAKYMKKGRRGGPKAKVERVKLTPKVAELFGWYVAEGSVAGNIKFFLGKHELNHALRIKHLLKKHFKVKASIYDNRGHLQVSVGAWLLGRFLKEHFGGEAPDKKIPRFLLEAPKKAVESFLDAYFKGDGSDREYFHRRVRRKVREVRFTTASPHLAFGVSLLMLKVGKVPRLDRRPNNRGFRSENDEYRVRLGRCPLGAMDERFIYLPIRKIKIIEWKGPVYNIKTEDGTFTAPLMITHNCPEDNVETILKTIRFWRRNQITCKPFYETPYPGTELFEMYKDKIIDYFLEDEERELIKKLESEGRKSEVEEIKLRGLGRYVERLGDAIDLVVNLNPNFNELEMLGLQQAMFEKDERRIIKWKKEKENVEHKR